MTAPPLTVAVVVTHKPEIAALARALRALCPQIGGLVLVDNGSGADTVTALKQLVSDCPSAGLKQTLFQPENHGLGQAQNAGIAAARGLGADCILLLDQDSLPAPDMVAMQHAALAEMRAAGARPAAIGAHYAEPGRATGGALPPGDDPVPEMPSVIASGTLIPLDAFDAVGPFDEGLFVDFVDIEWCFRARAMGYRCFAARAAHMQHRIGGTPLRIFGRNMAVHDPPRTYYQMRNILLLVRRATAPRRWMIRQAAWIFLRCLVLIACAPSRITRARMTGRAIWHGCLGRDGKLNVPTAPN